MVKIFNESRSMRYRIPRGETALLGWYKDDDGLCPRASRRMSHLLEAGWPRIEKKPIHLLELRAIVKSMNESDHENSKIYYDAMY